MLVFSVKNSSGLEFETAALGTNHVLWCSTQRESTTTVGPETVPKPEFGIGLGLCKRLVIIGPREHAFHFLPQVECFASWADFLGCQRLA
jgi:hypothetical protein